MFHDSIQQLLNRTADSHKYSFGHVLVIGGAVGTVGAPLLSARAALRSGAGLVTIASEAAVINQLAGQVPEIMTRSYGDVTDLSEFIEQRKVSVIVVGPGLTVGPATLETLKFLFSLSSIPLIIDGGALSSLAGQVDLLQTAANPSCVLTPHHGEFKRLLGTDLATDTAELIKQASDFAARQQIELILKGHPTFVIHPDGAIYENTTGNPGLATAGSGDVLTGVIGAMLSQKLATPIASEVGVYLHGLAGDIASAVKTQPGVIASDIIESIPQAFQRVSDAIA